MKFQLLPIFIGAVSSVPQIQPLLCLGCSEYESLFITCDVLAVLDTKPSHDIYFFFKFKSSFTFLALNMPCVSPSSDHTIIIPILG